MLFGLALVCECCSWHLECASGRADVGRVVRQADGLWKNLRASPRTASGLRRTQASSRPEICVCASGDAGRLWGSFIHGRISEPDVTSCFCC